MADGTGGAGALGCGGGNGEPEVSDSLKAFGEVVKAFRKRAGLTQEQFAPRVQYSVPTVASIEQGRRFPPPDFVKRAEEVLDAFGALRGAARHLSRQPGLASWFRQWARLEEEAITLWTYECRVIPGLLQTEAYARAMTTSVPPVKDEEQVDRQVAARLERQELFRRKPPIAFSFIVEQALIERGTGGVEVTRELLSHLLDRATQFNIELQIMPLRQPDHAGFDGPMRLAETVDNRWLGYSEGQRGGMLVFDRKEVSIMLQRYARMRSQALTPEDSRSLLMRMQGAL
ncbi:helix-turn-helix transcriptional regulator [Streptomyces hirsutus]|uniref:helix-turn-helix domain-containing protein n=1 Tax=Streptomyces hirsutus TaxID=35620 RepID=UPI00387079FE|nr:helix-turn-helix transcriptional regulator [Streptomyces hirsutus]